MCNVKFGERNNAIIPNVHKLSLKIFDIYNLHIIRKRTKNPNNVKG